MHWIALRKAVSFPKEGWDISSPKEEGTIVFVLFPEPLQKGFHKSFTLWNRFPLHDPVYDCGIIVADALEISQSYILSITTGLGKPYCSDIYLDNHSSVICTSSSIFQGKDEYNINNVFHEYD